MMRRSSLTDRAKDGLERKHRTQAGEQVSKLMEWISSSNLRSFVSRPDHSLNFLYNNYDPFPATGMEMVNRHFPAAEMMAPPYVMAPTAAVPSLMQDKNMEYGNQEKKKRLTNDQLDSLENSFQEEIKLDPDRKMKLAKKLGLQPRQVAVWFQNRRARWKAKQLESLYESLKQAFDAVSREKHKLQQEVSKLKAILMEQTTRNQVSTGYIDISGDETVESTSAGLHNSSNHPHDTSIAMTPQNNIETDQCHYIFNVDEYDAVSPYWGALPPYS